MLRYARNDMKRKSCAYHIIGYARFGDECTAFLDRVEAGDCQAVTTDVVINVGLTLRCPVRWNQCCKDWHRLSSPIFKMVTLEAARSAFGGWIDLALIAGFYLEPEMEERLTLCDGLAVHVNAYIGVNGDRSDEAFTTETGYNYRSTVVSLQPPFRHRWHPTLLSESWLANS